MNSNKISVIIPAYNEEKTIAAVINLLKKSKIVNEIIVVNNASEDNTYEIAKSLNVVVINCNEKGKGYAMKKGIEVAKNEIITFIDADIENYPDDIIERLTTPLLNNEYDFVKSTFNRKSGGIVTEVVTKPLLKLLYPDIISLSEPLSGMIAGFKSDFTKIKFENDYGVDIGIVIDMHRMNKKIIEVNIGDIVNGSHISKNNQVMAKMSSEIMNVMIKKTKI